MEQGGSCRRTRAGLPVSLVFWRARICANRQVREQGTFQGCLFGLGWWDERQWFGIDIGKADEQKVISLMLILLDRACHFVLFPGGHGTTFGIILDHRASRSAVIL